jgi:hypothetical protein
MGQKSKGAISLAGFRPFISDFLKVWFGVQTTASVTSKSSETCEPCGPRFPNFPVVPSAVRAFSVPSPALSFPNAS